MNLREFCFNLQCDILADLIYNGKWILVVSYELLCEL